MTNDQTQVSNATDEQEGVALCAAKFRNSRRHSPFVIEATAIELANSLESSRLGIEAYRSRSMLYRVWEAITGQGQERVAAILSDIRIQQQATTSAISMLLDYDLQTKYCLGIVQKVLADHERRIAHLERKVDLHLLLDILTRQFENDRLFRGYGIYLGSALFFAHYVNMSKADESNVSVHWERANLIIESRLRTRKLSRRCSVTEFLMRLSSDLRGGRTVSDALIAVGGGHGPLSLCLQMLLERRVAGLANDGSNVHETAAIVHKLYGSGYPESWMHLGEHYHPRQLLAFIAYELTQPGMIRWETGTGESSLEADTSGK